jgi:naphthalene 1,2-dioxygenase system ferredoxin subunit
MSTTPWTDAMAADELPADDVKGVIVAGRDIAIYTVGDEVYATDNLCTHGHARLSDGFLEGREIECPLHQGSFDIRTGKPVSVPSTKALGCCLPTRKLKDTTVTCTAVYDNTSDNPNNPDPNVTVRNGDQSKDEMMQANLDVTRTFENRHSSSSRATSARLLLSVLVCSVLGIAVSRSKC